MTRLTNTTISGALHALVGLAVASLASPAQATVLTFDQIRVRGAVVPTISGNAVPQDYGDRVSGSPMSVSGGEFTYGELGEGFTPNVIADYFGGSASPVGSASSLWADQYGDLENVLFGNQNSSTLNIRLSGDGGYQVLLYGFDLAGWPQADYTIAAVRVSDGATTVFEATDVLVEGNLAGPRHTTFAFGSPLTASALLITLDYSNLPGTQQDNIGIDNVRFGQSPPGDNAPAPVTEPGLMLLMTLGVAIRLARSKMRRCTQGSAAV